MREAIDALAHPDFQLILDIARVDQDDEGYRVAAEKNYKLAREKLAAAYGE